MQSEATPHASDGRISQSALTLPGRAVLLAFDDSPASNAAARISFLLAQRHGLTVHVVSVIDTSSAPMPPGLDVAIGMVDAVAGPEVHKEQTDEVRGRLAREVGVAVDWPVTIALGRPAAVIVRHAGQVDAALVLVGLRRHGRIDRVVNDETALDVMRRAACPVLGVVAGATGLPRKVLAAVDFSASSLAAAQAALPLMGDDGILAFAYVPSIIDEHAHDGEARIHDAGVAACFAESRSVLEQSGVATDQVVLHRTLARPVAETLLEHADEAQCDLIAVGSTRRTGVDRWMMGSVSTEIVRDGRVSVLVVPPR